MDEASFRGNEENKEIVSKVCRRYDIWYAWK